MVIIGVKFEYSEVLENYFKAKEWCYEVYPDCDCIELFQDVTIDDLLILQQL